MACSRCANDLGREDVEMEDGKVPSSLMGGEAYERYVHPDAKKAVLDVAAALDEFLSERSDRFRDVTDEQKKKWVMNMNKAFEAQLDDNDFFYDNMPEDVEEI